MAIGEMVEPFAFQSTPPRREVTCAGDPRPIVLTISIHTSPKGGDAHQNTVIIQLGISIHTSPKGGDDTAAGQILSTTNFNPHLPEGR